MSAKKTFLTSSSIASAILVVIIILTLTLAGSAQANATETSLSPVIIPVKVEGNSLLVVAVGNNKHNYYNSYIIAFLNSQEYNTWKSQEPHNSSTNYDLPSESVLAKDVSEFMTIKRVFQAGDYYLIIIRIQGTAPIDYFFSTAPYDLIFAISLFGFIFGLLSFIAFVSGTIALIQYILLHSDKKKKERSGLETTPPSPSASKTKSAEKNVDKTLTSDQAKKNPFVDLQELLEQAYARITTEELALILLGLFLIFLPVFGPDAYDSFPLFFAYLFLSLGPLFLLIALILYVSRAKQRKDLISYLEIRRTASISELQQFFSLDGKKIRQLILDAIRIDGVNLKINEEFEVVELITAPVVSVARKAKAESEHANALKSSSTMRCPFCAAETSSDSLFCSQCGASLVPPK